METQEDVTLNVLEKVLDAVQTRTPETMFTRDELAALVAYLQTLRIKSFAGGNPEQFRREKPSMRTEPLPPMPLVDYATAGMLIQQAMHHLDEALPTGQKIRAELAVRNLRRGVEELAVWMRARGYDI